MTPVIQTFHREPISTDPYDSIHEMSRYFFPRLDIVYGEYYYRFRGFHALDVDCDVDTLPLVGHSTTFFMKGKTLYYSELLDWDQGKSCLSIAAFHNFALRDHLDGIARKSITVGIYEYLDCCLEKDFML